MTLSTCGNSLTTGSYFFAAALAMAAMSKAANKDYKNSPDIKWNFTKFLVDRNGNVVARFEPTHKMEDVEEAVKKLL